MTPNQMTEPASAIVTADEMRSVVGALDELANDYAHRAEMSAPGAWSDRDAAKAEALAALSQTLKDRMGNEDEWTR